MSMRKGHFAENISNGNSSIKTNSNIALEVRQDWNAQEGSVS